MKILKLSLGALFLSTNVIFAQEDVTFQKPSESILELADYQRPPSVSMDRKKEVMLLSFRPTYETLEQLGQEEIKLAGLRINPKINISSRVSFISNLKIRKINSQEEIQVKGLPENPQISYVNWSDDQKKIAFLNTTSSGNELWVLDVASAQATKLTQAIINANLGDPITWFKNSEKLLIRTLVKNQPQLIKREESVIKGPIVSQSILGKVANNRTYQDLLKNKTDEFNFKTLVTSELHSIDLKGSMKFFKKADMYLGESFSPDGNYIKLITIQKPFSYVVPYSSFPMLTTVYTSEGNKVKEVYKSELFETTFKGFMSVKPGKRSISWRADKPASLYFVEALDGGDSNKAVDFRDAVYTWEAPFKSNPQELFKTQQRFSGIIWGDEKRAVVYDSWYDTRSLRTFLFNPEKKGKLKLIFDRNSQDIYSDPGNFQTKRNKFGRHTLRIENNQLFLIGSGFGKDSQKPFLSALNLKTFKTNKIFETSGDNSLENIISIVDFNKGDLLVNIQSKDQYPNYFIRNFKNNSLKQLTFTKNPFESIKDVSKEIIKYKREDGVELSGTLYLPLNYDKNAKTEKLPLLIWAYPNEYKDKNSAGQIAVNKNQFVYPFYGSLIYWVTKGYAVLDAAAFPIVGQGKEEPNDTFIEQLAMNAKAAIDAVDALGYIDRKKVAIGGHSYGAFMTANLLTHTDLFACGIARSGAYNRTLTPFGFQSEQRNYWEATDVYNKMSPFMNAPKMKTPLLLIHGEADNNSGTFTFQTQRYFQALKSLGAPVRMVLLPRESHSYKAKENILHLLWEQEQFLDKYLKGKK